MAGKRKNIQGKDPTTFQGNSQGRDPSTPEKKARVSSNDASEFCNGVGGIILLLDIGGAFTCELSYLISLCGSTNSQSGKQERPSQNSVSTEERETSTTTQASDSRSDRSSVLSKRSSQERSPPPDLSLDSKIQRLPQNQNPLHLLLTVPIRCLLSPLLFFFCPFLRVVLAHVQSVFFLSFSHVPLTSCSGKFLRAWPCTLQ